MKPNKPGEWHARDGRKIVVAYLAGRLSWRPCNGPDQVFGASQNIETLEGDDWLPAVAPEFPELPPKPKIFHCFTQLGWRSFTPDGHCVSQGNHAMTARCYVVVPHPDNDPEAIHIVSRASNAAT